MWGKDYDTNSINNGYGVHCTEEGVKSYVAMNEIKYSHVAEWIDAVSSN